MKRVAVRAVELSTGAFCTEFRCEQLCDDDIFSGSGSKFGFFTKRVAVRAVEVSTGAFCTEFRCEQLCDDDIFFGSGSNLVFFMKRVAVRAQKLSTIAFCTEFRSESNRGVGLFQLPPGEPRFFMFPCSVSLFVFHLFCIF